MTIKKRGVNMRRNLLMMFNDLKESGSESDWPYLLGDTMHKTLLERFKGFPSPWRQYCKTGRLSDFRNHDRIILSEAPDLLKVGVDGVYQDAKFSDRRYRLKADTYGRTFTVGRRAIINDDLDGILAMPKMFGRASIRSLVKTILEMLSGAYNAYDGSALFAVAHGNYGDTALANTAAGMAAVAAGMAAIEGATDPDTDEPLGLTAKYILTGTTLGQISEQLVKSAQILPTSTNGGGTYNSVGRLTPLIDPLVDSQLSSTAWFILADPADAPTIEVGFLDGKEEPDLLVSKPEMKSLAGGNEDPYGYEFDELKYKVRWDWGVQLGYYQSVYRGKE